jgi:hypothetical protein
VLSIDTIQSTDVLELKKKEIAVDENILLKEIISPQQEIEEKTKNEKPKEPIEISVPEEIIVNKIDIPEKQITVPIDPPKPTFDELVNKVKEQMNHQSKPQVIQFVSQAEEEDEDQPVSFSDLNLDILFSNKNLNELSDKLSQSHIDDIGKAMGLNERIFTLNELFNGDNSDFEKSLVELNSAASFAVAKEIIATNLAVKYNWLTDSKIKKARDFVKLVKRRYI